jgi:hypothetical protein
MLLLGTKEIDLFWGMAKERPGLSPAIAQKAVKEKKRATPKEWPFAKIEWLFDRYDLTESARILD